MWDQLLQKRQQLPLTGKPQSPLANLSPDYLGQREGFEFFLFSFG